MLAYKCARTNGFSKDYLHSFSQGMSVAYRYSLKGMKTAYRHSADFLSRRKLPIALASIPLGVLLTMTDYSCMNEIGYTTIGGGLIETLIEIKDRRANKKAEEDMRRFRKYEVKRMEVIHQENESLRKQLAKLNRELQKIRKLEEQEVKILNGKP